MILLSCFSFCKINRFRAHNRLRSFRVLSVYVCEGNFSPKNSAFIEVNSRANWVKLFIYSESISNALMFRGIRNFLVYFVNCWHFHSINYEKAVLNLELVENEETLNNSAKFRICTGCSDFCNVCSRTLLREFPFFAKKLSQI